jgi:hypothetical protein
MNREIAHQIVEFGQMTGHHMDVYEKYSGRGMMGETTTGITANSIKDVFSNALLYLSDRNVKSDNIMDDIWQIMDTIENLREDDLGLYKIYY